MQQAFKRAETQIGKLVDENADEEMLRYEFSKHAPIKVRLLNCWAS